MKERSPKELGPEATASAAECMLLQFASSQAIQDFFDHASAAGQSEYKAIMRKIVNSLRQLPCDVLVEPHELEDACIRMMKTIPEHSSFKVCIDARNMAQRVLDTVQLHRAKLTVQNEVFEPN
mmetsp:Transcript_28893/g.112528  ORF Transcript_28893/g.112528 Transcript_28893/m.112528 type:complete len:123 (+) Transcript_28893:1860-2228(+)